MLSFMTAADVARIQALHVKVSEDMATHGFAAHVQALAATLAAKTTGTFPSGGEKAGSNTSASNTGGDAGQDKSANLGNKK